MKIQVADVGWWLFCWIAIALAEGALAEGTLAEGTIASQSPLVFDELGQVVLETEAGVVIKVSIDGQVELDGEPAVACTEGTRSKIEMPRGVVKCYPSYIRVEHSSGYVLKVYESFAKAEDRNGNQWSVAFEARGSEGETAPRRREESAHSSADSSATPADTEIELGSQGISVRTPEATVELGRELHIRSSSGTLEVSGAWRSRGLGVPTAAEAKNLLLELGAIREQDALRLELAGDIYFDFDSSELRPEAASELAKVARVLRFHLVEPATVSGHTDALGTPAYNQKLSEQRALKVLSWLHKEEGIPLHLLHAQGHGARKPRASNSRGEGRDDPDGRARNRRVEILVPISE